MNRVQALLVEGETLLTVIQDELVQIACNGDSVIDRYSLPDTPSGDLVNSIYLADDGSLWLGFEQSGLYLKEHDKSDFRRIFISKNDLANSINHITGLAGTIWIASKGGVCRYSTENKDKKWFTTDDGLPHNHVRHLYIDKEQRVLLSTLCSEIHYITFDGETGVLENSQMGPFTTLTSIAEGSDGSLWTGTQGNGVWRISDGENLNYSVATGLSSDFCYSLILSQDGHPVVSHRGGFSVIDPESNRITRYGRKEGIKSSMEFYPNAVAKEASGQIWFGTSEGLVSYMSGNSGKNMLAPKLSIKRLLVDGIEREIGGGRIVLPAGQYEITVEYIGISFTNPEMVLYQTKLEGYNKSWSDYREARRVVYDRVGHGEYMFRIRAFNEKGLSKEIDAAFVLKIKKPIYFSGWFYISIFLLVLLTFYIILKARERKQIRFQALLQKKLDESTSEVIKQKEEIEDINLEITKSINYAKRIQTSIMPPVGKLEETFSRAFVFYQPKDIVSGDFYWFDDLDEDTFAIVCADCTGHGVPGAFMSMIGITLIKDICSNESLDSPSQLLQLLDREIKSALNRNLGTSSSVDGMDMVAGFYNKKTMQFRMAGAMNPLIIYRKGEQTYVQGNRFSIGGRYEEPSKEFETKVFDLQKGDKLYLYSDGYPDQFGGPRGKKFKTSGLKTLLNEIQHLPFNKHSEIINDRFHSWKGELDQIDDVIFMGFEI